MVNIHNTLDRERLKKSVEEKWLEIYQRAITRNNRPIKERAFRELVKLGIADDIIAWEVEVETYYKTLINKDI